MKTLKALCFISFATIINAELFDIDNWQLWVIIILTGLYTGIGYTEKDD